MHACVAVEPKIEGDHLAVLSESETLNDWRPHLTTEPRRMRKGNRGRTGLGRRVSVKRNAPSVA